MRGYRADLPSTRSYAITDPDTSEPLRILLVAKDDFAGAAEMQVLGFANELSRQGHSVMVSIGGSLATFESEGLEAHESLALRRHRFLGPRLSSDTVGSAVRFQPHLVHAWNPRVPTICVARQYAHATAAPYFVHFEDSEFHDWPLSVEGDRFRSHISRAFRRRTWRLYPPLWYLSTPTSLRWARDEARGLDAITPALASEVAARLGRHCTPLLPVMFEAPTPGVAGTRIPRRSGDEAIVLFTGRVVPTSISDVQLGMRAVALARARGVNVRLVQTGSSVARVDLEALARQSGLDDSGFTSLGHIPFREIAPTLRAADVLIQPGRPSEFNRLRLPSKLQSYLASGTPTITFSVGFGELLRDREEVLMTYTDDVEELTAKLIEALTDSALRARLTRGAVAASRRLFDPAVNTAALVEHYRAHLNSGPGFRTGAIPNADV